MLTVFKIPDKDMANILQNFVSPNTKLLNRNIAKWQSTEIVLNVINNCPKSPLLKSYWNTYYCVNRMFSNESGKIQGIYCKNKWCIVCNKINSAVLINSYTPQIKEMKNPMFLTLTSPTVTAENLKSEIERKEKCWRNIYYLSKKAKYKNSFQPLKGIRKCEATINFKENKLKYHYHYHFIIDGEKETNWVLSQWLRLNPDASSAASKAIDMIEYAKRKRLENPNKPYDGVQELFKYTVKTTAKLDKSINAKAYDWLFLQLRNKRAISTFGGIKKMQDVFDENDLSNALTTTQINGIFEWVHSIKNYVNINTGELIINETIPKKQMQKIISDLPISQNRINQLLSEANPKHLQKPIIGIKQKTKI